MNKTTLFIIFCVLISLSSCQTQQVVYDLKEETYYVQKQGGIFAVDLLKPEGDSYIMGGWSTVRIDGTRLGVYPISRIKIPVFDKEPLYLFFKCEPFARDQIPAEGFRFRTGNKTIAQVELAPEEENLIKVALVPHTLELGDNILQIYHVLDEEIEGNINQEEKKRIRTAVFYEMMLSSHSDYDMTKRYVETKERIDPKRSDILIQKVPGTLDYHLNLPANAWLSANYEFLAANPSEQHPPIQVTISLKNEENEEEIVLEESLGKDKAEGKIRINFPAERGVTRLRLKAGEGEDQDSFKGLLVWKKAYILSKPKKR